MTDVTYLNWDAAREELEDCLLVIDAYSQCAYVRAVTSSPRWSMLASAWAARVRDWRAVNEFLDKARGLCDLILQEETRKMEDPNDLAAE